jgi:hypothetical protein
MIIILIFFLFLYQNIYHFYLIYLLLLFYNLLDIKLILNKLNKKIIDILQILKYHIIQINLF